MTAPPARSALPEHLCAAGPSASFTRDGCESWAVHGAAVRTREPSGERELDVPGAQRGRRPRAGRGPHGGRAAAHPVPQRRPFASCSPLPFPSHQSQPHGDNTGMWAHGQARCPPSWRQGGDRSPAPGAPSPRSVFLSRRLVGRPYPSISLPGLP